MNPPLQTRRYESLQAEYLTNDDPEVVQAADLELSERLGTALLLLESSKPSAREIEAAVRVLRGAVAQERAWGSFANDEEACLEACRLERVVKFLVGVHHE